MFVTRSGWQGLLRFAFPVSLGPSILTSSTALKCRKIFLMMPRPPS
ncbi:MAG: hypothetical protein ACFE9I_05990 [Candidatus Hermodarchaeota archaeon]